MPIVCLTSVCIYNLGLRSSCGAKLRLVKVYFYATIFGEFSCICL